jgi:hypothetical protein
MLLTAERRRRISAYRSTRLLEAVDGLPVTPQPGLTAKQLGDLFHLARKELALHLDLPLATGDASLIGGGKEPRPPEGADRG